MTNRATIAASDIKTPHGLKLGTRIRKEGRTVMRYKQGKHFDELTAKEAVECIEGFKIKELIIIPDDDPKA